MKILHVGNHTWPCVGGLEKVLWDTARIQAKLGNNVTVMVFDTCTDRKIKLLRKETKQGVRIIRVPQFGPNFYRIPPLKKVVDEAKKNDIVHIHGIGAWLDLLSLSKFIHKAKIVVTSHGGFFHTKKRKTLKWCYKIFWLPILSKFVDYTVFISALDAKQLSPLAKKGSVIPNGVEMNELASIPFSKKKNNQLIFVGRLSKNKRVDHLIESFARVVKEVPCVKLTIVGEDWEKIQQSLEKRAKKLFVEKNITFCGSTTDKKLLEKYTESSVFVSASEYEGFGISAVEAMAAGCIPCLNSIPTFREFTKKERGFAVDFSNPEESSQKLKEIILMNSKKANEMRKRCRDFAKNFELEKIIQKQMNIYREL
jgi:alpha-1,3-mannosyltransferase